jgi:hypothetical protein
MLETIRIGQKDRGKGSEEDTTGKKEPTSMNLDGDLWKDVRKAAIDKGITATEFVEQALREKLAREKEKGGIHKK